MKQNIKNIDKIKYTFKNVSTFDSILQTKDVVLN